MKNILRPCLVMLITAMSLLLAPLANAQSEIHSHIDEISKRGVLRVGVTGDYRPFSCCVSPLPAAS